MRFCFIHYCSQFLLILHFVSLTSLLSYLCLQDLVMCLKEAWVFCIVFISCSSLTHSLFVLIHVPISQSLESYLLSIFIQNKLFHLPLGRVICLFLYIFFYLHTTLLIFLSNTVFFISAVSIHCFRIYYFFFTCPFCLPASDFISSLNCLQPYG